jgi:D-aspartate ligase
MQPTTATQTESGLITGRSNRPLGAVVLGGDYQGLGIVRSLGRRKIPVCVIDDERSIARYSQYATHSVFVADLRNEGNIVRQLIDIGKRLNLGGWVLFPTRDEMVVAFARCQAQLKEHFCVTTPDWKTIQWAWDKRNTYRLAAELSIPTPETWYPVVEKDLDEITLEPPFVIKPAIKENFFYATKAKAWRADDRDALRTLFNSAAGKVGPGEVMIQELVPGGGQQQFAYCAFFKNGNAIASMVVRRSRQHPREFGRASTYVETIDLPILEQLSERFLRAINYYGLVEMEYKLDLRDGQYKLLDVNGRTWGYHSIGHSAGVDFPSMLFADQSGETVSPCRAKVGVRWIRLLTDVPTAVVELIRRNQNLRGYLDSLRTYNTEAVFCRDDPFPGVAELALFPYLLIKRGF